MAFAGLIVGWLIAGSVFSAFGSGPWSLALGPVITGVAALFYAKVGPRWSRGAEGLEDDAPEPTYDLPRTSFVRTLLLVVNGIAFAIGGSILLGWLLEKAGLSVQEQGTVLEVVERSGGGISTEAIVLAVSALFLAPLAEEWLFRGLLFRRVAARSGRGIAYAITALGFAALHVNPTVIIIYAWLGLVFAAVYERTGWLGAAVAVHMGNNAFVLGVLFSG